MFWQAKTINTSGLIARVAYSIFLGMFALPGFAANWQIEPSLGVTEIYTDNIDLVPDYLPKDDDFITQIVPAIDLRYPGRRAQLSLDYQIQSLIYSSDSDRNSSSQRYNLEANTEVLDDLFFFDLLSSRSQQLRDPERAVSLRNLALQGNVVDVLTSSADTYFRTALSTSGSLLLGYRRGWVDYKENDLLRSDSELNSTYFNAGERNATRRLNWQVDYRQDEIIFEQLLALSPEEEVLLEQSGAPRPYRLNSNRFEQQQASLIVTLSAKTFWQIVAGEEDNEFNAQAGQEIDGSYWRTGIQWGSGPENGFELWLGDRFFGRTGSLKWFQSGRYMRFDLGYAEELFTDAQRQLGATMAAERASAEVVVSRASSGVYLRSRSDLTLGYDRSNSIITLIVFNEEREFQSDGSIVSAKGASLAWDWSLTAQTSLISRVETRYDQLLNSDREDDLSNFSFTLRRRVNSRLNLNLELAHEHLHTNIVSVGYHAYSLLFGLDKRF